ncbi:MAG: hypothetical protein BWY21_00292 [Parcubacteria group bacterium ADurb.Bin216]|jgi:hypothetical protein|nr:MAG: hypothetical protein BWY21_00292 [Parcubacteria group bacterium ADurb.Bin216]
MKQTIPKCQVIGCVQFAVDRVTIEKDSLSFGVSVCQKHLSQLNKKVKK